MGELLRTTCSPDEVCLSDSVPEVGEKYPNRQLEVILRTTVTPQVKLSNGTATIRLEGRAFFFLEGTSIKVGKIPFETIATFFFSTIHDRLTGSMAISKLIFKKDVDFFDLPVDSLNGLRDATKGATLNLLNTLLKKGLPLNKTKDLQISEPLINIVHGAFIIQVNFDLERDFYNKS
ncbi:unnamed protein product [Dracunculus medinensis]|uniref:Lipid-binding serum glycoprotein C-terminal domain-containing protein n=1 Tax=Dracunculus medinensis TaxID=318479 RepID=A0A3P7SL82_DRAME|nr:unnamed protein product [Dracunculus medinensis]